MDLTTFLAAVTKLMALEADAERVKNQIQKIQAFAAVGNLVKAQRTMQRLLETINNASEVLGEAADILKGILPEVPAQTKTEKGTA